MGKEGIDAGLIVALFMASYGNKIDGIPLSDGFAIFIDNYKDKVVFSAYGETEAGFFLYDPTTGTVEGPVVSTTGAPTFMYSFE